MVFLKVPEHLRLDLPEVVDLGMPDLSLQSEDIPFDLHRVRVLHAIPAVEGLAFDVSDL